MPSRRSARVWRKEVEGKVGVPSREEQDRIVNTLRIVDLEIGQFARLSKLVQTQRRVLLDRLLSGRISIQA